MENGVLVDSSVFIHLLRKGFDPVAAFLEEFGALNVVTCGIVKLEVLRGIKTPKARAHMEAFLSVCQFVPTTNARYDEATELAWSMDRAGQVIPATDIIIAVSARFVGASVLTLDKHFSLVPGLSVVEFPESWL